MWKHLFSKLGVPIKTTVSATVLEEALNGSVSISPLQMGQSLFRKVLRYLSCLIDKTRSNSCCCCNCHMWTNWVFAPCQKCVNIKPMWHLLFLFYVIFLFLLLLLYLIWWIVHSQNIAGREAMCTLLFCTNNRAWSKNGTCLSSAFNS